MLIQGYFYPSAPSIDIPKEGAAVSGQSSHRQSNISTWMPCLGSQEHVDLLQETSARVSSGRGRNGSTQTVFKVRPIHRGRGHAKLSSYPESLVFQISLIPRKLSGTAPAGRADPNCDFFQSREAPPGQTGSDHSA